MERISPPVGNEISCVMYGINNELLKDGEKLHELALESLKTENFKIITQNSYNFQPYGFSLVIMLAESHLAIHTFPEYNSLFFYLYSCRGPEDGIKAFEHFKNKLNPETVELRERKIKVKLE